MKKAMPYLAIAAPVVMFALLLFLVIEPERRAATSARARIAELESEPARAPSAAEPAAMAALSADEFGDVADALSKLANSRAVGGVSNLAIELSAPNSPVTMSFDTQYPQVERFFANLATLPVLVELRAVELTQAAAPMMRAKIVLMVFKRNSAAPAIAAYSPAEEPSGIQQRARPAAAAHPAAPLAKPVRPPDPIVTTILFSETRRAAQVDGRIVGVGDRVGPFLVKAIERDAVVFVTSQGLQTRVELR